MNWRLFATTTAKKKIKTLSMNSNKYAVDRFLMVIVVFDAGWII